MRRHLVIASSYRHGNSNQRTRQHCLHCLLCRIEWRSAYTCDVSICKCYLTIRTYLFGSPCSQVSASDDPCVPGCPGGPAGMLTKKKLTLQPQLAPGLGEGNVGATTPETTIHHLSIRLPIYLSIHLSCYLNRTCYLSFGWPAFPTGQSVLLDFWQVLDIFTVSDLQFQRMLSIHLYPQKVQIKQFQTRSVDQTRRPEGPSRFSPVLPHLIHSDPLEVPKTGPIPRSVEADLGDHCLSGQLHPARCQVLPTSWLH